MPNKFQDYVDPMQQQQDAGPVGLENAGYVASEHTPEAIDQQKAQLQQELQDINSQLTAHGADPGEEAIAAAGGPAPAVAPVAKFQDYVDPEDSSALDAAATGFNTSISSGAEGIMQLGAQIGQAGSFLKGMNLVPGLDSKIKQVHAQEQAEYEKTKKEHPIITRLGYVGGELGQAAVVPAARGANFLGRLATGAASGAGFAQANVYDSPEERVKATGITAGTSGLLSGALGNLGANRGPSIAAAKKIADAGGTVGQVTGKAGIQTVETSLSKVPVIGMRGKFKGQVKQVIEQVDDYMQSVNPKGTESSISPAQLKSSVVQGLSKQFSKVKGDADALYKLFSKEAAKTAVPVETNFLRKTANSILNAEKQSPVLGEKANNIIKAIQPFTELQNMKPSQINALHKTISDLTYKMKALGPEEGRAASRLFAAWNDDLGKFSKTNPTLGKLFERAKDTYKNKVGPLLDDPILSKAIKGQIDSDQLLSMAVKNERPELIRNVMKNLTPSARGNFREAILKNVYNDSLNAQGIVEPLKFFSKLQTLGDTLQGALARDQRNELKGLTEVVRAMSTGLKAGSSQSSLDRGLATMLLGGGAYISPGGAIAAVGGIKVLSSLLSSPKVGMAMVRLGKVKPNTKAYDMAFKAVSQALAEEYTKKYPQF